jgi:hypothetical protein
LQGLAITSHVFICITPLEPFNIPPKLQLKKDRVSGRKPYHKTYKYGGLRRENQLLKAPTVFNCQEFTGPDPTQKFGLGQAVKRFSGA